VPAVARCVARAFTGCPATTFAQPRGPLFDLWSWPRPTGIHLSLPSGPYRHTPRPRISPRLHGPVLPRRAIFDPTPALKTYLRHPVVFLRLAHPIKAFQASQTVNSLSPKVPLSLWERVGVRASDRRSRTRKPAARFEPPSPPAPLPPNG